MYLCICSGTPGASNYLLAIFFMNLTIYGIYYCAMKQINGEKINKIPLVRFLRSLEVLLFHEGVFLVIGVIVVIDVILLIVLCRCTRALDLSALYLPSTSSQRSPKCSFLFNVLLDREIWRSTVFHPLLFLYSRKKSQRSLPPPSQGITAWKILDKTIIHNLHLYHLSIYIYPLKGDEPTLPVPQLFWRPRHLVLIFYRNSTLFVFFYRTSTLLVFFYKKNCSLCFLL